MTVEASLMLGILAVMFGLLVWGRFPSWLVFMGALTGCMTFKLAPHAALLKGFSNSGVVTVAALFPVAAGMFSTGAISLLTKRLFGRPKTLLAAEIKNPSPDRELLSEQHADGRPDDPRYPGSVPRDRTRAAEALHGSSVSLRFSAAP